MYPSIFKNCFMANISALRRAGFFKEFAALNDEELLNIIQEKRKQRYSELFGHDYDPEKLTDIRQMAWEDTHKMLHMDLETDVCAENSSYTGLLEVCDEISGREKIITEIREHWESETGPIRINYKMDGQERSYQPNYLDDWVDQEFLDHILSEIASVTGESFHLCLGPNQEWFGQDVNYIRLTVAERKILEEELGWQFFDDFLKEMGQG